MATYELGGCTYDVRRETVRDQLDLDIVLGRLLPSNVSINVVHQYTQFARYGLLTTVNGQLPFGRPITDMTTEELKVAANAWLEQDPDAVTLWREALAKAKQTPNASHLQPEVNAGN